MGIRHKHKRELDFELDLTLIHISMAAPPDLCTLGKCNLKAISGGGLGPNICALSTQPCECKRRKLRKCNIPIESGSTPLLPLTPRERSIAARPYAMVRLIV